MGNSIGENVKGKHVVLSEKCMGKDEPEEHRVFLARDGFGCHPDTIGKAVFTTQIATGLDLRVSGYDLDRFATEEEVQAALDWKEENPPREFDLDDVQFRDGKAYVTIYQAFRYPVHLDVKGEEVQDNIKYLTMHGDYAGLMSSYVYFVKRDIEHAVENNDPIDDDVIEGHMEEYAKGWLAKTLGLKMFPIDVDVNLDELPDEKVEKLKEISVHVKRAVGLVEEEE